MSFTFNGENCESHELIVQYYPARAVPARKQEIVSIPGKSGDEVIDEEAFTNCTQEYEVYFRKGVTNFAARAEEIVHWLLSPTGYADLTDTYDRAGRVQKARVIGGMSFVNHLCKYGSGIIQFDCQPQRYEEHPSEETRNIPGNTDDMVTLSFPQYAYDRCWPLLYLERQGNDGFRAGETIYVRSFDPVSRTSAWAIVITIASNTEIDAIGIDTGTGEVWVPGEEDFPAEIEITETGNKKNGIKRGENIWITTDNVTDPDFEIEYTIKPRYFWI